MNRRELLKLIAAATGCAMIGMPKFQLLHGYDQPAPEPRNDFTADEVSLLNEIAETIIPKTDTPGAKDAGCGVFIAQFVTDCYSPEEQATFRAGLADIDTRTQGRFMQMPPKERTDLFRTLHAELKAPQVEGAPPKPHYFTMFKQLTLFAFFTSEVGATKVLRYVPIPGRFENITYEPGMPAWAT